jgi:hypothetical protein
VTWTAAATCPSGTIVEYRFWIMSTNGTWTVAQDWSTAAAYDWPTSGLGGGAYAADVDVRRAGMTMLDTSSPVQSYSLSGAASGSCSSVSLSVSPPSPTQAGTALTFTATSVCPSGTTPEYRYWEMGPGGKWNVNQDWSSSSTMPFYAPFAGDYSFMVDVRRSGTSGYDATSSTLVYTASQPAGHCTGVTLAAVDTGGTTCGGPVIRFTATATCPAGVIPQYRFYENGAHKGGTGFTPAATLDWDSSTDPTPTQAKFYAEVSGDGGTTVDATSSELAYPTVTYGSGDKTCLQVALTPLWPQASGTTMTTTLTDTCAGGPHHYRYWRMTPAGWSIVQDWTSSTTLTWDTTGLVAGQYRVNVDIGTVTDTFLGSSAVCPYILQ